MSPHTRAASAIDTVTPTFMSGPSGSRDGTRLAFTAYRSGRGPIDLYVIGADGTGLRRVAGCGRPACHVRYWDAAWSPAADEIAVARFVRRGAELELLRSTGKPIRSLAHCAGDCEITGRLGRSGIRHGLHDHRTPGAAIAAALPRVRHETVTFAW